MLRNATLADIEQISEMAHASYGQLLAADYPAQTIKVALPVMAKVAPEFIERAHYVVWDVNGQILGGAGWSTVEGGADVRKVAVHPDHLRQGIGQALMAAIEAEVRAQGHRILHCASSLTAVRFYQSCGFDCIGTDQLETSLDGVHFDIVTMRKTL